MSCHMSETRVRRKSLTDYLLVLYILLQLWLIYSFIRNVLLVIEEIDKVEDGKVLVLETWSKNVRQVIMEIRHEEFHVDNVHVL